LLTEARPEVRFHILCALTNQLRYVNCHTQYFSTALVHMFSVESDEIRQSLMNVFVNRLSMARPHPWGLLVTMLELIKNPAYDIWNFSWIKAHPQVENMLMTLVQHQERMPHNSPMRSVVA
jgi:CCR4-NOT transcription complex subunit 1